MNRPSFYRSCAIVGVLFLLWLCSRAAVSQAPRPAAVEKEEAATFVKDILPFLSKNCLSCHSEAKRKGDVSLEKYKDDESLQRDRKMWDKVVHLLRSNEMPPKERPQPTAAERASAIKAIEFVVTHVDCSKVAPVTTLAMHRLNRSEYNNTIRDLFDLDIKPAFDFPNDETAYGFDNISEVLTFSDVLLERYLIAADLVLDKALPIVKKPQPTKTKITPFRSNAAVKEQPLPTFAGLLKTKNLLIGDAECEEGDYWVRAELSGEQVGDEPVKATIWIGDNLSKQYSVASTLPDRLQTEWKVRLKADKHKVYVAFDNPYTNKDAKKGEPAQRALILKTLDFDGPYNPPPPVLPERTRAFLSHAPGLKPREAAKEIVTRFATRAYRRPVKSADVDAVLKVYDKAEAAGEPFEIGIRWAIYRVLMSPHFLFRVEADPQNAKAGNQYALKDFELASRLSYFFWSSMPDEELFELAGKGELRSCLDAQVQRMLKDPKSSAFVENFCGQWLTTRYLATLSPSADAYPDFDEPLRKAMGRETELFFDAMLRENRSVLDFLDADFTFVNERLAKHYGIKGIKGSEFQRVATPPGRRGILTQASILTLTSVADRTSPVKRGKWVLEQILNTPPPPPPPNLEIPALEATQKQLQGSLRQVLEEHRKNATCAGCHQRMDPIGLGLENFDGIGAFRETDNDVKIDPSGVLTDGSAFKGPAELIRLLRGKKELFTRAFADKMLTYGLGRGLEFQDACVLDKIMQAWQKDDFRFNSLLVSIVKSDAFLTRVATRGSK